MAIAFMVLLLVRFANRNARQVKYALFCVHINQGIGLTDPSAICRCNGRLYGTVEVR